MLDEAARIKEIAQAGQGSAVAARCALGVIYTIGPYLLPALVRQLLKDAPQMPLLLTENFTVKLLELLKNGEIDVAIMALPLPDAGLVMQPVYDEPFVVAVPRMHRGRSAQAEWRLSEDLKKETMLLLGTGHCFRDQVLEVLPGTVALFVDAEGIQKTFEGSSLETIRHMVASGLGVTVLPKTSMPAKTTARLVARIHAVSSDPVPDRRAVLAWRKSVSRACRRSKRCGSAVLKCPLHGCIKLDLPHARPGREALSRRLGIPDWQLSASGSTIRLASNQQGETRWPTRTKARPRRLP